MNDNMSSEFGRVILILILINAVLAIDLNSIHIRSKLRMRMLKEYYWHTLNIFKRMLLLIPFQCFSGQDVKFKL